MKLLLILGSVIALPTFAAGGGDLDASDYTGVSFWLVTAALLASTVFFFVERDRVSAKWKTSLTVSGLVTGIAFWHYMYMRGVWIETGDSPTVFRYLDWLITVPLLMVELYIVLLAVTKVSAGVFHRLLGFSTLMLVFGYLGESGAVAAINSTTGFVGGMLFWGLCLRELWSGEAAEANAGSKNAAGHYAYDSLKKIVTFGWAIYPAGYFTGYLMGDGGSALNLNLIYNLADFVNKILFGLIIWNVAVKESSNAHHHHHH